MTAVIVEHYAPILAVAAYVAAMGFLAWLTTRKGQDHE